MSLFIVLLILPFVLHKDPAPGLRSTKAQSRNLECDVYSAEAGDAERPGQIKVSPPRGDYVERAAVICRERLLRPGLRAPRDEAILSRLDEITTELGTNAADRFPELAGRRWLVESFYPDAQVSAKLSFATKDVLVSRGLLVTDRTPLLAAGDVDVLTHMAPEAAYPAACQRYAATGTLGAGDALLAVISLDSRETILHAGLCVDGAWTWLQ